MMLLKTRMAIVVAVAVLVAVQPFSNAQSSLVQAGARQIIEAITERFGQAGLKEVMEKVGQDSIEDLVQRAMAEGGESAANSAVKLAGEHGLQAIVVLRRAPVLFSRALGDVPDGMVSQGLGAIERDPDLMTRAVTKLGGRAIQAEVRHPGIGARLVDILGDDGIRLADTLSTDEAKRLMPYAQDINSLSPGDKGKVIGKILRAPAGMLDYLEKHPKMLVAAGGAAAFIAIKDNAFGGKGNRVVAPDGTVTEAAPGFLEQAYVDTINRFGPQISYVIIALGGAFVLIVLLRGGVYVSKHRRLARIRVAAKKARTPAKP